MRKLKLRIIVKKKLGKKKIIPRFQHWSLSTRKELNTVDSRYDKPFFMGRLINQPTVNQELVDASTDSSFTVG